MRKFKFFLDYEKEEKWLADMAKHGYELNSATLGYRFKETESQNANIKIDYRLFKNTSEFINYITMFEDSGWKHIAGTKNSGSQYFKKMDPDATDDIFSDKHSQAGRYKRLSDMWVTMAFIYLPLMVVLVSTDTINLEMLINPKMLYYTPGLWDKTGFEFWKAFLFETPFAFLRGFLWLMFPLVVGLYIYFAVKAYRKYREELQ